MSSLLLRPLNYLAIRHESRIFSLFNWILPAAFSALAVCACFWLAPGVNLFHAEGLIAKILNFVQNMPGFYLAALAAVATFGKADLDQLMPGRPPTAVVLYNGQPVKVQLTRRRFLSMMFSYLTALSLMLTIGAIVATAFVDALHGSIWGSIRWVALFAYLLFFIQMLVVTLWGLYYLGERIHTPDS